MSTAGEIFGFKHVDWDSGSFWCSFQAQNSIFHFQKNITPPIHGEIELHQLPVTNCLDQMPKNLKKRIHVSIHIVILQNWKKGRDAEFSRLVRGEEGAGQSQGQLKHRGVLDERGHSLFPGMHQEYGHSKNFKELEAWRLLTTSYYKPFTPEFPLNITHILYCLFLLPQSSQNPDTVKLSMNSLFRYLSLFQDYSIPKFKIKPLKTRILHLELKHKSRTIHTIYSPHNTVSGINQSLSFFLLKSLLHQFPSFIPFPGIFVILTSSFFLLSFPSPVRARSISKWFPSLSLDAGGSSLNIIHLVLFLQTCQESIKIFKKKSQDFKILVQEKLLVINNDCSLKSLSSLLLPCPLLALLCPPSCRFSFLIHTFPYFFSSLSFLFQFLAKSLSILFSLTLRYCYHPSHLLVCSHHFLTYLLSSLILFFSLSQSGLCPLDCHHLQ
ncbi:hypothetical protein VP01_3711g1 [Puccinia sorghi]|uniref:Uncharacterized protein n=1 Tax=Puccinia sorghi TaxID=27349 RepID=A0A0L6UU77_9BASI|nr:hypothetical protein VP01_3711g1 [Puccinia sorghi]